MSRALTLVAVIVMLCSCERGNGPLPIVGTLEMDRVEVVAEAREILLEVGVAEGQAVGAGDVIARQDPARARIELDRAVHARDRAMNRLAELERGPRAEEIVEAKANLAGAESRSRIASREHDRVADLVARNLASDSDLDAARMAMDLAVADRKESAARLEAMLQGTTIEEIRQAEASLAEADATVADRKLGVDRLTLRAPRDGVIDAVPVEAGDRPQAGDVVAVLLTGDTPFARVYVPAEIRARVAPGMAAVVRADGIDGALNGRVRIVAAEASFTPYFALTERDRSRLAYVAEIELGEDARHLPTGIPVEADFPALGPSGD
jgi:HlyD family secretion protein